MRSIIITLIALLSLQCENKKSLTQKTVHPKCISKILNLEKRPKQSRIKESLNNLELHNVDLKSKISLYYNIRKFEQNYSIAPDQSNLSHPKIMTIIEDSRKELARLVGKKRYKKLLSEGYISINNSELSLIFYLGCIREVENLNIRGINSEVISDSNLLFLKEIHSLLIIRFADVNFMGCILEHLKQLKYIKSIGFYRCIDLNLKSLPSLSVTNLVLFETSIYTNSEQALLTLKKLKYVDLIGVSTSNAEYIEKILPSNIILRIRRN